MRMAFIAGLLLASLSCAVDNPRYEASHSAGSGSTAASGTTGAETPQGPGADSSAATTSNPDGTNGAAGTDSGTTTSSHAETDSGPGSSTVGQTTGDPVQANDPCRDLMGVGSTLACWDFDLTANQGLTVLDRSDGGHDLELATSLVGVAGFWGQASDTTAEVYATAEIGDTLPETIEIWLSSQDDASWNDTIMALRLEDNEGILVAQIDAAAGTPPIVNFSTIGHAGFTFVDTPLSVCIGMDFSANSAGAVVAGSVDQTIGLAVSGNRPSLQPPYHLVLEANFVGFIDGIRVGVASEANTCAPAPPP